MQTTILKFPMEFQPENHPDLKSTRHLCTIKVPQAGRLRSVQPQEKVICAWFEVCTSLVRNLEERQFELFGTGWAISAIKGVRRKFVATVQLDGFVWHIYELSKF